MRVWTGVLLPTVLVPALRSCGSKLPAASSAAVERFYHAIDMREGAAACDLLAPQTVHEVEQSAQAPFRTAILDEDIPNGSTLIELRQYGTQVYIVLTVWLVQRGSPESKPLDDAGRESDQDQKVGPHAGPDSPRWAKAGGWRTKLYSSSLGLVMGSVFLACWLVQLIAGWSAFNEEQLKQLQDPQSWLSYAGSANFWSRSLQNWQSEFLAVGSMAVLSIYLREHGSPESKPVGTSHDSTGVEG